jgi:hypothetical protein
VRHHAPFRHREHFDDNILRLIGLYVEHGNISNLESAARLFVESELTENPYDVLLELSIFYEKGLIKYGEGNWTLGIPLHCFIDSGVRHYLKHMAGKADEPHDLAFLWNILGAIWTHRNKPEMIDLPFKEDKHDRSNETRRLNSVQLKPIKEVKSRSPRPGVGGGN